MSRDSHLKPQVQRIKGDAPAVQRRSSTPGATNAAHRRYAGVRRDPDAPKLDTAAIYAAGEAHRAAVQRKAALDAASPDPYDPFDMIAARRDPVQRKAVTDAMDAPKEDSIREDRATIDADATPARGGGDLGGGISRDELGGGATQHGDGVTTDMDAPKEDSIREDRATIDPDAEPGAASAPHEANGDASAHGDSAVADMGAPKEDSIQEDRATIEPDSDKAAASSGPLSPAKAARAARKNHHWAQRLRLSPAAFGVSAGVASPEFAQAVARFQAAHGLTVDGIAGPKTAAALQGSGAGGETVASRGDAQPHPSLLQMKSAGTPANDEDIQGMAAVGVEGSGRALPHLGRIQASFGEHDVTSVRAHVGGTSAEAATAIGAEAYATGNDVAFRSSPDLHTAAHEAAHVVQQRAGVQLKGGVGAVGDQYEQHADKVADAVVGGQSAEALLDAHAGATSGTAGGERIQRKHSNLEHHERGAAHLALQQAAALARAGKDSPTELACFRVADSLRYAASTIGQDGGHDGASRRFLSPADLAYARAAALHDAAAAALGDENVAVTALLDAMLELAGQLEPLGWRRPANARAAGGRAKRARRRGAKETFGAGDRKTLVRNSLSAAGDALALVPRGGGLLAKTAVDAIAARAHHHMEFAFDQMLDADQDFASLHGVVEHATKGVPALDHQGLVLRHRSADLLDTVNLANRIRAMVGLPAFPAAEMSDDELAKSLAAVDSFLATAEKHLNVMLTRTALAYKDAWERHTKALDAQKRQQLHDELIKEAVVSAITGGLGGIAGHIMKVKLGLSDSSAFQGAVIDGIKNLTKTLVKKGMNVPVNVDGLGQFPPDPLAFFLHAKLAANSEMEVVLRTVLAWKTGLADGTFLDRTINPLSLYREMLTVEGTPVLQAAAPDQKAESRFFELGFWRTWLTHYAYTVTAKASALRGVPDPDNPHINVAVDVKQNWGDWIVKAINDLGEDGHAWVQQYGAVSKRAAKVEQQKVYDRLKGISEA